MTKKKTHPNSGLSAKSKILKSALERKSPTRPHRIRKVDQNASQQIDARIRSLSDWRGLTLVRMRKLILAAVPQVTEEWKWNNPVWSHDGILCTGESYANVVKLTFARGANLPDPSRLFNSSLDGKTRRAIDIRQGESIDASSFKALIKAAVALNQSGSTPQKPASIAVKSKSKLTAKSKTTRSKGTRPVVLLSGGNPQIAKANGDAPVQAYIVAMPGWKRDLGSRLDNLIEKCVPGVQKAVKWNSPFYGMPDAGWFLAIHCFAKYVKVTFFQGTSLRPIPPGGTPKSKNSRWLDIYENNSLNEAQFENWVRQAARLPGWMA